MVNLSVDYAACVLTASKASGCDRCAAICPTDAIIIRDHALSYVPAECIRCGACQGVCPTESFTIDGFSYENFVSDIVSGDDTLISCKKNLPCLAALGSEYLIALSLEKKEALILDTGHCEGCAIAPSVMTHIETSIDEANAFLAAFRLPFGIIRENVGFEAEKTPSQKNLSRRELFARFTVKEAIKTKMQFDRTVEAELKPVQTIAESDYSRARVREKTIPFRRAFFISATRGLEAADGTVLEAAQFSFITDKRIEKERCTNCALCYHACPTGALVGDRIKGKIAFDFLHCVACNACHDACGEGCLHKEEQFGAAMFTRPERKKLATFFMRQCYDCGMPYIHDGYDVCPRCRSMDEEARELVGF